MATKSAPRKRKVSGDFDNEILNSMKRNFDCGSIVVKKPFPFTDNHKAFYYLTQNPKTNMVFLDGPAGSMKSYISVYSAVEMLKSREVDKIIYIRTVVESASKSLGFLKGDEQEKFAAYTLPLYEKLAEITDKATVNALFEQEYVKAMPVNFVRGLTFNNAVVIIDEAQNATRSELTTIMTRFGRGSKYIICGDAKQSDIKDSGFTTVFNLFDTEFSRKNNIHCHKFDITDISRSAILKHITQVLSV